MQKVFWRLGTLIDVLHMPMVIVLVFFSPLWVSHTVYISALISVVILQLWLRTCPLNPIVYWLKRGYEPDYKKRSQVTKLYDHFGRAGAFLIISMTFAAAAIAAMMLGTISFA